MTGEPGLQVVPLDHGHFGPDLLQRLHPKPALRTCSEEALLVHPPALVHGPMHDRPEPLVGRSRRSAETCVLEHVGAWARDKVGCGRPGP